jgi:hypothetical protein
VGHDCPEGLEGREFDSRGFEERPFLGVRVEAEDIVGGFIVGQQSSDQKYSLFSCD